MTWSSGTLSKSRESLLKLLIVRCLTPSRIVAALDIFINETFNNNLRWRDDSLPQIRRIATVETKSPNPVLLCCGTGQDASSKVTGLAKDLGKELLEVSMGSKEGFEQADKSLVHAAKAGCWVLLRNVHLCTEWLVSLDKRLQSMTLAADFRLFLTSDISDTLPTELVKRSDVAIYEASTGIKANLLRFFNSISASRIESKPTQRVRLYALLGWLDAVVQERLRYAPLGWSKRYEFSDSDAKCSLDIIDEWLNELIASKAQITPETLPWDALKVSLSQSYYGGRVDNRFDQAALDSFIDFVFSPASFAASAPLAVDYSAKGRGAALVTLPNGLEKTALEDWISKLPDISSTEWLGLPASAENQLQSELGLGVLSTLMKLSTEDVDNAALSKSGNDGAESSVTVLGKTIEKWIAALPVIAASADKTSDVSLTSIERCLTREVTVGVRILNIVRNDLQQVLLFTKGTSPSTNRIREVIGCCNKQEVPKEWTVGFPTSPSVPLGAWISELILRTNGLNSYKDILAKKSSKCTFVIGRMFSPESFITATRQMAAQVCAVSCFL
jgi:dynein heavy chain 1